MSLLGEYIARGLTAADLEQELLKLIGAYNKYRGTYLLVYAAAISKQIPAASLSMDDYQIVYDLLKNAESKKCDLYLETPGGSGEAAEEIVRFLRTKFENVDFIISGESKSAGTLMVLSANEILMTHSGSLGPLDAQIKIGRSPQSAYDYMDWIKTKRKEAQKVGKLNPFDATMVAQISPGELNGVNNALNFAKDLVIEWLPKYKFKNWNLTETRKITVTPKMKKQRARQIVNDLVDHNKWRSHGRSIKISDLEAIGLKIQVADSDPKLSDIVYRIQTVIKLLFSTTNNFKIMATQEEKIFVHANPAGTPPKIQPQQAEVARLDVECPNCGQILKIYARFIQNPKIDVDLKKEGYLPFPNNNKIKCSCGFEIDIIGLRNDLETKVGKKVIN